MTNASLEETERRSGFDQPDNEPDARPEPAPFVMSATPFVWSDPRTFPRRQWLYGRHLIRKFISCTVAPGGVGKTSLLLVEAIAMATGRNLLGIHPTKGKHKVWVINLEDPREEIERRILAILLHYDIDPAELDGQLFVDSGREVKGFVIATMTRDGIQITQPVVDAFKGAILARGIDVTLVDPFVKSHRVPENDNGAIDFVATTFSEIADETNSAFDLVHHVRKTGGGEITVEDGRGAVALLSAVRSARVLNPMTKDEADNAGGLKAREHFRSTNGKANLAPPPDKSDWYRLTSVSLDNGEDQTFSDSSDHVAVVIQWAWPDPMADVTVAHLRKAQAAVAAGRWRENHQAKDWVGKPIGIAMGLDITNKVEKAKVIRALKTWIATGMFVLVEGEDEKRNKRTFVEVGQAATD